MFDGRANVRRLFGILIIGGRITLLVNVTLSSPSMLSQSVAFDVQGSARTLATNKQDWEIFGLVARRVTQSRDVVALPLAPNLDFGRSGGLAKRVGDAVAERGAEFSHLCLSRRQEQTLLTPELPPDSAEGVGEGRPQFAVPSIGADR